MAKMNAIDWIATVLVLVGGINWGLEVFNWNLVEALFGSWPWLVTTIYALVGISAIWAAFRLFKN